MSQEGSEAESCDVSHGRFLSRGFRVFRYHARVGTNSFELHRSYGCEIGPTVRQPPRGSAALAGFLWGNPRRRLARSSGDGAGCFARGASIFGGLPEAFELQLKAVQLLVR